MGGGFMRTKTSAESVRQWRKATKQRLVDGLGGKCVVCGYDRCNRALELHHIDPSKKELSFGDIMARPKSWEKIVKEAKKCVLLCSNCHKEVHDGMADLPKKIPEFIDVSVKKETSLDKCPQCGKLKPVINITCSRSCAGQYRYNIKWDSINLKELLGHKISYSEIGRMLGCSDQAVKKRAKRLKLI